MNRSHAVMETRVLVGAVALALGTAAAASQTESSRLLQEPGASSRVPAEEFAAVDRNLDGVISRDEASDSTVLRGRFSDADANRDGAIDRSEFAAYEVLREDEELEEAPPAISPDGADGPDQLMDQDAPPTEAAASNMQRSATADNPAQSQPFEQLDRNADGVLSRLEAEPYRDLGEQFSEADADLDGRIDRAEFAAFELEQSVEPPEMPGLQGEPIIEQPAPAE